VSLTYTRIICGSERTWGGRKKDGKKRKGEKLKDIKPVKDLLNNKCNVI